MSIAAPSRIIPQVRITAQEIASAAPNASQRRPPLQPQVLIRKLTSSQLGQSFRSSAVNSCGRHPSSPMSTHVVRRNVGYEALHARNRPRLSCSFLSLCLMVNLDGVGDDAVIQ